MERGRISAISFFRVFGVFCGSLFLCSYRASRKHINATTDGADSTDKEGLLERLAKRYGKGKNMGQKDKDRRFFCPHFSACRPASAIGPRWQRNVWHGNKEKKNGWRYVCHWRQENASKTPGQSFRRPFSTAKCQRTGA
jgi:hypothetical protein